MKKVCFTGHRYVKDINLIIRKLLKTIENLINEGAEDFYTGGALGFDTLCSVAVLNMKNVHPQIKLHLILPCSNNEQTEEWSEEQKNLFDKITSLADSVEYTSECYTKNCMMQRNARLVELSDVCVCYYTGKYVSGTGQTIRMAIKKGVTIYNLYDFS